ncbi:Amino Acid/Auxin Permease (AAAP) Family [Phytophthora palmivora]|uniref:Amino Acid/Auxin Permease (AAAP) Family n=1 Tax=Phytophthora palmivora TaxID=4796 RepID=A0A2P4YQV4_9STRA|nr:Amino Acid/Auxin Permease (AAAP) Family [Phytophthora palmivora]
MSGNLLFSVVNTSDPYATTTLGFIADRGAVVMAFLFMQMHLSIAFSTFLHPAFYMFERMLLGMHKVEPINFDAEEKMSYINSSTPAADLESNQQRPSRVQVSVRQSTTNTMIADEDLSEYKGGANVMRYIAMRIALITVLVVLSILLRSHFLDLVDFTGATFITLSSLIVPLMFYIKVFWTKVPAWEKLMCVTVATICTVCGIYVMIYAGKNLFNPDEHDEATFPYCSTEFQEEPYYIRNETS